MPATVVPRVRETALLLCGATAEALHLTIRSHTEGSIEDDEIRDHRARLADLDSLLKQLDAGAERAAEPTAVQCARDVVRDAVYGALIDAGERVAVACDASWRGASIDMVLGLANELTALEAVLRQIDGKT
jgi:hypothetical protein